MSNERFVAVDTETTGLHAASGDRIIQIAAVEIINRQRTGNHFVSYVNPQGRPIAWEAFLIHQIAAETVAAADPFELVYPRFLEFIGDGIVIIHNKQFDLEFLAEECAKSNQPELDNIVFDSIDLVRELWPGQQTNLDAVCKRLSVSLEKRTKGHDALIDCELLADAYIRMLAMRETPREQLNLLDAPRATSAVSAIDLISVPLIVLPITKDRP